MSLSYADLNIDDCWNQIGVFSKEQSRCERLAELAHCLNCDQYTSTGRLLLNRPLPDDYRRELSEHLSHPIIKQAKRTQSAFIFRAGDEWLGVTSTMIKEVVDMGPIHSIPHKSSRIFRGIVNIRGRLELCVSIGGVLRIEPGTRQQGTPAPERLIVAAKDGQSIVFPVSEVMGPVLYDASILKPLPITVSGSKAVYTKGILNINDQEVGMLDDAMLFRILTRNLG
ncbi:MAG: chemotaxis protein CheW [Proteobacteria bacterium]|nr:chemotaxis protein CheW [Pseudomonadota bacterium]MDP2105431.1 chemotaxis protein CheW [Desulfobulbaceae bacterium]